VHWFDWVVLVVLTTWIVFDGLRRTKDSHELDGYLLVALCEIAVIIALWWFGRVFSR